MGVCITGVISLTNQVLYSVCVDFMPNTGAQVCISH
jgi:hypothetical protein